MTGKEFVHWIEDRGWVRDRSGKGSHIVYRYPPNNAAYVVLGNIFRDAGRKMQNMMSRVKRLEREAMKENSCRRDESPVAC